MANQTNSLNIYLANLAVLNIKVHNLHWNVTGREFKVIHKLTEKIYKELLCQYDAVAEAMKMQDELPLATMAEYMDYATVAEIESRDYNVREVLDILASDLEILSDLALEIRNEADEEDNFIIANMFEEYLAKFYKTAWFVKSMLAQEDDDDIQIEEAEFEMSDNDDELESEETNKKSGKKKSATKKK